SSLSTPPSSSLSLCAAAPRALHSFPTRRSSDLLAARLRRARDVALRPGPVRLPPRGDLAQIGWDRLARVARIGHLPRGVAQLGRSEEHTSELQSRENLVCRLLLEKKKKNVQ